jgi:hypothetical protein
MSFNSHSGHASLLALLVHRITASSQAGADTAFVLTTTYQYQCPLTRAHYELINPSSVNDAYDVPSDLRVRVFLRLPLQL